jgi:putative endonuclease
MWFVYIIEASDNSYYTGVTTDIPRRFNQHSSGKGAKYFRARKPVKVVYSESEHTRSSACARESAIKKLSKEQKRRLIFDNK